MRELKDLEAGQIVWRPVKGTSKPQNGQKVLLAYSKKANPEWPNERYITTAYFRSYPDKDRYFEAGISSREIHHPSHWAPLPIHPEEITKEDYSTPGIFP